MGRLPGRIVLFGLVLFGLVWLAWFVWVLRRRFGKAAIIRPRAPPLDDARTLSVSAGDQLPRNVANSPKLVILKTQKMRFKKSYTEIRRGIFCGGVKSYRQLVLASSTL